MNGRAASGIARGTKVSKNTIGSNGLARTGWALIAFASLSFATSRAAAFDMYVPKVQSAFGMPCPPPCSLCHVNPQGGGARRDEAFAQELKTVFDNPTLAKEKFGSVDKNADGKFVYDELAEGKDPLGAVTICASEPLEYGCAIASSAPKAAVPISGGQRGGKPLSPLAPWLVAIGALAFLSRRVVFGVRRP